MSLRADTILFVLQGEYRVSRDPDEVLATILGSCVAVCLWDEVAALGGMNHFLLPFGPKAAASAPERYGVHAMEILINAMLKAGGRRSRFKAKLFGGARLSATLGDIGQSNALFARDFLATEGIPCISESLGGTSARRVQFRPVTGQVRQLLVPDTTLSPPTLESPVMRPTDIVLF
ncbi:chemotaxis protein CheD [Paracoccaceae bacterium Fryx2]|nr:chemotaxis protein CheD [Paracoccaceae bacterium Fryx2]